MNLTKKRLLILFIVIIFMTMTSKRIILLAVIIAVAFVLGRLAVREVLNLLLGGTLFGGNIL